MYGLDSIPVWIQVCTDQTRNVMVLCLGSASPTYFGDCDMHAFISDPSMSAEMIITLFVCFHLHISYPSIICVIYP